MKLIEFPQVTHRIAENQEGYETMPAFCDEHQVVCCWELTEEEIAILLNTRKIWQRILHCGQPVQPQLLQVTEPFIADLSDQPTESSDSSPCSTDEPEASAE